MDNCRTCGKKLEKDDKFCQSCGSRIEDSTRRETSTKNPQSVNSNSKRHKRNIKPLINFTGFRF